MMTQEENQLLLKYLCMAQPYGVIIEYNNDGCSSTREMGLGSLHDFMYDNAELKPYLRSMSSMTEEEKERYHELCDSYYGIYFDSINSIDWLNVHHFDYRGLIKKGLAIEVTEDNNPYET